MQNRLAVALVTLTLIAPTVVVAQTEDWTGYYIGGAFTQVGGRNGDIEATLRPAVSTTIGPPATVPSRTFSRERNLSGEIGASIHVGRLFDAGSLVIGLEAQLTAVDQAETFVIGPVPAFRQATPPTTESVTADLELSGTASLRARAGLRLGDRVLVSAFAGPTAAKADLSVRQATDVLESRFVLTPFGLRQEFFVTPRTTTGATESQTLWGGVVGGMVEAKLSESWSARAEASLSFYDAIEARSGGGGAEGGDSAFSYEPNLYSFSLGLTRRF